MGDVHGQAHCLDALMDRIEADRLTHDDERRSRIVLLGDYIDRGADSRAVLDRVAALLDEGAVALAGNHEDALLTFLRSPVAGASWLTFGGVQTLASYGIAPPRHEAAEELSDIAAALAEAMGDHVALLRQRLMRYLVSGDVVFVHADLEPRVDLDAQDERVMLWGHPTDPGAPWRPGKLVVHGHYAEPKPVRSEGRIGVDTGAYFTNTLTAVRLDESVGFIRSSDPAP
ncbi:metallophosphoesterase [Acuticoccus sediminis]|uniref:metallophosphoesterase n=1 Tax=Acuticoccus sediminis TaxID=2184697 RepID=UPI0013918237|nr:metallophosphoesterase [Acuticoccus sediminis]